MFILDWQKVHFMIVRMDCCQNDRNFMVIIHDLQILNYKWNFFPCVLAEVTHTHRVPQSISERVWLIWKRSGISLQVCTFFQASRGVSADCIRGVTTRTDFLDRSFRPIKAPLFQRWRRLPRVLLEGRFIHSRPPLWLWNRRRNLSPCWYHFFFEEFEARPRGGYME